MNFHWFLTVTQEKQVKVIILGAVGTFLPDQCMLRGRRACRQSCEECVGRKLPTPLTPQNRPCFSPNLGLHFFIILNPIHLERNPVDPARWKKIQDLFAAALERPPAGRDAFLRQACAGDEELLREVASLLSADQDAHSILEGSAIDAAGIPRELSVEGKLVGAYRIVKQVGSGGMGAVYLAERADGQFQQKVALKVIKRGMDSEGILRRFQSERQILAQLEHPNIVRLLDGGMTDDGLPFFTMEYVEGEPIDSYCDRLNLTIDERLDIFRTICSTVQYAHRNLVVHRDLKPSNILVTKDGSVKLLDFGIAKMLDVAGGSADVTGMTLMGVKVMTPEYASPEQVRGEPVTTASDVYSLGVILYQLLSGHHPYRFPSRSPADVENVVRHTEPKKPSTVAQQTEVVEGGTTTITPELVSKSRGTMPEKLRKRLAGDLDTICIKALQKVPEQRYGSVEQLLGDLIAHAEGRAITARPATVPYRVRKFVQRHRTAVIATAGVFLMIAVLVVFYTLRLAEERDRAQLEALKAEQVSDFLTSLFKVSDPSESRGQTITARELLERGATRIERELSGQQEVQATMMNVVGKVFQSLGLYDNATGYLERSLDIRKRIFDRTHPVVATSLNDLGSLLHARGLYPEADSLFRQALAIRRSVSDEPTAELAQSMNDLGMVLRDMGAYDEAEPLLIEALAVRQRVLGVEHQKTAESLNNLALMYQDRGEYDAADSLMRFALRMKRKLLGEDHPEVSLSLGSLAFILQDKGEYDEAETLFREALALDRRIHGEVHPAISTDLYQLASLVQRKGEYDTAETLFRQVLELDKKLLGAEHPYIALDINNIASVRSEKGDLKGAESLYREALVFNRKAHGEEHPEVATSFSNLGSVLNRQRRYAEAEPLLRRALELRRKLLGKNHPHVVTSLSHLAALTDNKGDSKQAASLYREVLDLRVQLLGERHPQTAWTMISFGTVMMKGSNVAGAESLLVAGLSILQEKLPADHWEIANTKSVLGECVMKLKRFKDAEPLVMEGYEGLKLKRGAGDRMTQSALRRVIALLEATDRKQEAAAYRALVAKTE
jgi:serine/threonine protein kinase/Tfp pilus assembly protein PilF